MEPDAVLTRAKHRDERIRHRVAQVLRSSDCLLYPGKGCRKQQTIPPHARDPWEMKGARIGKKCCDWAKEESYARNYSKIDRRNRQSKRMVLMNICIIRSLQDTTQEGRASERPCLLVTFNNIVDQIIAPVLWSSAKEIRCSDAAMNSAVTLADAAIDIVSNDERRKQYSYHCAPSFFQPCTSIPRSHPKCSSGFSQWKLASRVSTCPSLSSSK